MIIVFNVDPLWSKNCWSCAFRGGKLKIGESRVEIEIKEKYVVIDNGSYMIMRMDN